MALRYSQGEKMEKSARLGGRRVRRLHAETKDQQDAESVHLPDRKQWHFETLRPTTSAYRGRAEVPAETKDAIDPEQKSEIKIVRISDTGTSLESEVRRLEPLRARHYAVQAIGRGHIRELGRYSIRVLVTGFGLADTARINVRSVDKQCLTRPTQQVARRLL